MNITELPKEVLLGIWDLVATPGQPAQQRNSSSPSPSAASASPLAGLLRPSERQVTAVDPASQAILDRRNLSVTCRRFYVEINPEWKKSRVLQGEAKTSKKMREWVKDVSPDKVSRALVGISFGPEDLETITEHVRSFFDEISNDATFIKSMNYYIVKDRGRRDGIDDHPLGRYGKDLAGFLPKPYDTEGKSKHIRQCSGFSGSTELFGKTIDLGEGKDKIHILLGYNISHFGASGTWEMDILSSSMAQKRVNAG